MRNNEFNRIRNEIVEGLRRHKGEISVRSDGLEEARFRTIMRSLPFDFPELFFYYNYRYRKGVRPGEWTIFPMYFYDRITTERKQEKLAYQTKRILDKVKSIPNPTPYRESLALHNILVRNCEYDKRASGPDKTMLLFSSRTIEGVLISNEKIAVCAGITKAFKYLCDQLGIPCMAAAGWSADPRNLSEMEKWRKSPTSWTHVWNIVRTEYGLGHIDVTWDMCLTDKGGPIRYDYFFLSDQEMRRDHLYKDCPECKSTGMNYYGSHNLLFRSLRELDQYISRQMRGGKRHFCFKVAKGSWDNTVKNIVYKRGCELLPSGWTMITTQNAAQGIYEFTFRC